MCDGVVCVGVCVRVFVLVTVRYCAAAVEGVLHSSA